MFVVSPFRASIVCFDWFLARSERRCRWTDGTDRRCKAFVERREPLRKLDERSRWSNCFRLSDRTKDVERHCFSRPCWKRNEMLNDGKKRRWKQRTFLASKRCRDTWTRILHWWNPFGALLKAPNETSEEWRTKPWLNEKQISSTLSLSVWICLVEKRTWRVVTDEIDENRLEIVFDVVRRDFPIVRTDLISGERQRNRSKKNLTFVPRVSIVFVQELGERPFVILKQFDEQRTWTREIVLWSN